MSTSRLFVSAVFALLLTLSVNPVLSQESEAPPPEAEGQDEAPEGEAPESAVAASEGAVEGEQAVDLDSVDGEQELDLDSLEEEPETGGHPSGHPGSGGPSDDGHLVPFKFKLFFDLLVEYEWETQTFQFTKDHAYVVLVLDAADWLSFRTDVSPSPEFYEIIFHLGSKAELSLGKVLIPFGQNEWHHLIGGRVDFQSLFLPTIWADYGLSFKHKLYDGDVIAFDYSIWAVNGFQESQDAFGNPEPARNAGSLTDNNLMKGAGIRPALHIGPSVTVGTSWYLDAWDENNEAWMLFYGADLDLGYGLMPVPVLKNLRLRGEIAWAEIMIPGQDYYQGIMPYGSRRSGYNIEASYRIVRWLTVQYREGLINGDSRFHDVNDLRVHEPAIIVNVGPVKFTLAAQLLQQIYQNLEPPPEEFSRVYLRVLFRY